MRLSTRTGGRRLAGATVSVAVGALVLGILLVAGIGLVGLARLNGDLHRLSEHNLAALAATTDLSAALSEVRQTALDQVEAPDAGTAARLGTELDQVGMPRVRQAIGVVRVRTADEPSAGPQLDQIQSDLDRYQRLRADRTAPGVAVEVGELFDRMAAGAGAIRAGEVEEAAVSAAEATGTYRSTRFLLLGGAAAALLSGLVVLVLLMRRTEASRDQEAGQAEFADTLQVTGTEDEAHELVRRQLERSLPNTAAVVLKRNNSENRLEAATAVPADSALAGRLVGVEPRSCLALRFSRTHREDPASPPLLSCQLCGAAGGRSTCEPLLVGGQVIGSVVVSHQERLTREAEGRIRRSVALAAPVLANLRNLALAEFRANNDSLTGLPNKRATDDTLKRMVAQANRSLTPLAAAMLDLDHFKQVNDRFGHGKGDEVLAAVGAAVRSCLRESDFAGRYGGEELLVLLPDTGAEDAVVVAERMRTTVGELTVPGVDRAITVSIGIADLIQHAGDATGLLRQADRALYAAKAAGRNRTVVAGDPPSAVPTPMSGAAAVGSNGRSGAAGSGRSAATSGSVPVTDPDPAVDAAAAPVPGGTG